MARILVVDDDDQVRAFIAQLLLRQGYQVVEASDGAQAIRLFREEPADLIITDLIMPEKEGIETIAELRRDYPHVKIIAMSGGGRVGPVSYLQLASKLGAKRTFAKPFDPIEMLRAVREMLAE
ncbi:MAG TPA: response regulator [Sumerlaeia bacterium]|nr:response regulator [Sumerlaeia bacterium]